MNIIVYTFLEKWSLYRTTPITTYHVEQIPVTESRHQEKLPLHADINSIQLHNTM